MPKLLHYNANGKRILKQILICSSRQLRFAIFPFLLFGCAAQQLHDEGMVLIDQGQVNEGLAKLEAASKTDPENFSYRIDYIRTRNQIIHRLLLRADSQRSAGHPVEAATLYQAVIALDKNNTRAISGLNNLDMDKRHAAAIIHAEHLINKNEVQEAQNIVKRILIEDPAYKNAKLLARKIDEQIAKDSSNGPSLNPQFKKPVTLEFRDANLKMVVEALSRTSGLNILLDKDVRSDLKTTIFVKHGSVDDTIDLIALQDGLNKKILSDNTVLLYPNTPAKVKQYQDLMIRSFQLTNANAKDMEKMVKTLLKTRDMYIDEKTNSLVMRDTPDAIRLAEKLISAQDLPQPEVMLEVEVLEVTRSKLTELGVKLPEQIALSADGTPSSTTVNTLPGGGVVTTTNPSQPLTLHDLGHITSRYFSVSPINASIDLRDESGVVNILASPRIRVRNREKAKILIGDRVPVITNAVTPVSSGTPVVTGNVQYLDVGLKLDVQPYIHPDDDVEIKVNLEVSSIAREVSSGPTLAYQIGTRTANTVLRLRDGETQVLAGLINDEDRKAAQKFPGLGDLPVLGRLFSSHKNDKKKTEIVLSITPHLTRRNQRPDARNTEFWSGTEDNLHSRPIRLDPVQVDKTHSSTGYIKKSSLTTNTHTPHQQQPQPATTNKSTSSVNTPHIKTDKNNKLVALTWKSPQEVKVGEQFQVTIGAQADQPISKLSFTLGYAPSTFSIIKIRQGNLFSQDGKRSVFSSKIDPDTGRAFIYASRLGSKGISGSGSVAVVTFSARTKQAKAPIVITNLHAASSNGSKLPLPRASTLIMTLK